MELNFKNKVFIKKIFNSKITALFLFIISILLLLIFGITYLIINNINSISLGVTNGYFEQSIVSQFEEDNHVHINMVTYENDEEFLVKKNLSHFDGFMSSEHTSEKFAKEGNIALHDESFYKNFINSYNNYAPTNYKIKVTNDDYKGAYNFLYGIPNINYKKDKLPSNIFTPKIYQQSNDIKDLSYLPYSTPLGGGDDKVAFSKQLAKKVTWKNINLYKNIFDLITKHNANVVLYEDSEISLFFISALYFYNGDKTELVNIKSIQDILQDKDNSLQKATKFFINALGTKEIGKRVKIANDDTASRIIDNDQGNTIYFLNNYNFLGNNNLTSKLILGSSLINNNYKFNNYQDPEPQYFQLWTDVFETSKNTSQKKKNMIAKFYGFIFAHNDLVYDDFQTNPVNVYAYNSAIEKFKQTEKDKEKLNYFEISNHNVEICPIIDIDKIVSSFNEILSKL